MVNPLVACDEPVFFTPRHASERVTLRYRSLACRVTADYAVESALHELRADDDGPTMLSTKGSTGRSSILVLGIRRISGLKAVQSEPDTWLPS